MFTACDVPDEEVTERGYNMSSGECPPWECGYNSAEVNGRAIRELNLDGLANSDGMRIIGFIAPAGLLGSYKLDVQNDELVAVGKYNTLRGHQLLGATILVKPVGLLKPAVPITIGGYSEQKSWAAGGAPAPSYALLYPDADALLGQRNVCVGDLKDTFATSAVVLGGETYNLDTKTVVPNKDRWLTLACAGSAAAKLRLMNYGPQSDFDGAGNSASVAQRQATLKMLTADYCGDGTSYTANGTRLAWENADGTVATSTPLGALEAVWTSKGALCLEATRLANAKVACGLPTCDKFKDPLAVGEWLTHVPMVK
jgi:hypothetical protein